MMFNRFSPLGPQFLMYKMELIKLPSKGWFEGLEMDNVSKVYRTMPGTQQIC